MNFIQALEALRQGKKVRCKSWPTTPQAVRCRYIYFEPKSGRLIDNLGHLAANYARSVPYDREDFEKDDWEIYDPLLTVAERLYLNLLFRPEMDTDKLKYISFEVEDVFIKGKVYLEYYLAYYLYEEGKEECKMVRLPNHTCYRDELYKNLEIGRKYTPEELGIKNAPMGEIKK